MENDLIHSPAHYTSGEIECIDAIRAALTPEEFAGFCKGNIMKYVWREKYKGGKESLEKAAWYLARLTGAEPAVRKDDAEPAVHQADGPDWADAPDWANWVAQDEDGEWNWYEMKPNKGDAVWYSASYSDFCFAMRGTHNPNWQSTLQKRPATSAHPGALDKMSEK